MDDGSKDGSKEVCQMYAQSDQRIHYTRFEENSGLPAKRYNQGIEKSRGKYIAFMFDDDEWLPHALQVLHNALITLPQTFGMVHGLVDMFINEQKDILAKDFGVNWLLKDLLQENKLANNSVLIRREVLETVGGYDEDLILRRYCDRDLWIRISRLFRIKTIPIKIANVFCYTQGSVGLVFEANNSRIRLRIHRPFRKIPLRQSYFSQNIDQLLCYLCFLGAGVWGLFSRILKMIKLLLRWVYQSPLFLSPSGEKYPWTKGIIFIKKKLRL